MNETVFSYMKKKLREQMNEIADAMALGSCQSFDQYKHMVGQIEGLAWVERELIDLEERMTNG
jgi:hypothetical protein